MANRVLLGKNIQSNHGYSSGSPGYGLWISRATKNVLTCTADELIFNTDDGSGTRIDVGILQLVPVDANGTINQTESSISAGNDSDSTWLNVGSNHLPSWKRSAAQRHGTATWSGTTTANISNPTSQHVTTNFSSNAATGTYEIYVYKGYSPSALW